MTAAPRGVAIEGHIWRLDREPLDDDQFWGKFIDFIEGQNWLFAGTTKSIDHQVIEGEADHG